MDTDLTDSKRLDQVDEKVGVGFERFHFVFFKSVTSVMIGVKPSSNGRT
jgi:hypothetical protein